MQQTLCMMGSLLHLYSHVPQALCTCKPSIFTCALAPLLMLAWSLCCQTCLYSLSLMRAATAALTSIDRRSSCNAHTYLSCLTCVAQAATALASLAVAEQASAAGMLDACLTHMSTLSVQIAALLGSAPAPGQPSLFSSSAPAMRMPATPRALVTQAEIERVKPLMDGLHGNALGAAALLVSSTR